MIITIHNIRVKDGREHITFTSERNEKGLTKPFSRSTSNEQRLRKILKFIEANFFDIQDKEIGEFNTDEILSKEEEAKEEPEPVEEDPEVVQQREYRQEKGEIDKQIAELLEGLKEDKELLEMKEAFNYTSEEIQTIIDKKKEKFVLFEQLKTRLEELKELIIEDEDELV